MKGAMTHYRAPWSRTLQVFSIAITIICLTVPFGQYMVGIRLHRAMSATCFVPLAVLIGAAFFTVRGYTLMPDAILVRRLAWSTRLPLAGLQSVCSQPNAMRHSLRLMGVGGLFSFSGLYRNSLLGSYRAFVTDTEHTVVVRCARRTFVLSPDKPEAFVSQLAALCR